MAQLRDLKYEFIRTPFEQPLMRLREAAGYFWRRRNPELREVYLEGDRIDALWKKIIRKDTNCIDAGCHYGAMLSRFCNLAPGQASGCGGDALQGNFPAPQVP